jgi:hypothetical protein
VSYEKEVNRKYLLKRYYAQRQEMINFLGGKCNHCGRVENLEFDHVNWREKSFPVSKLWSIKDLPKVYNELMKCQLLCYDCHKLKSRKDLSEINAEPKFTHGTVYAWMKKHCKCDVCYIARRKWHRDRNKARRRGKGYVERF